jgi:hypothetical protein
MYLHIYTPIFNLYILYIIELINQLLFAVYIAQMHLQGEPPFHKTAVN